MELYDEDYYQKSKKKAKLPMIIGITIGILVVITIAIIYFIIYLSSSVMKIQIDGVNTGELEKILDIEQTEAGKKIYIPIRGIAKYLNYGDYSGDYKNKSEDSSKCHVKNEFETAMFTLNSDTIVKSRSDTDYEYVKIDEKVFEKNGQLYTTIDGVKKAFNVEISYTPEKNKIDIYTMDYLVQYYTTKLEIEDYSEEFSDKKAIFDDMLIINAEDGKQGVISATTGNSLLESKYEKIAYLPITKDFLVENNGRYGILESNGNVRAKIVYEEIKTIDTINGLYLIKQNGLYGIMDKECKIILEPEYQAIGIDNIKDFTQNGVDNQYVLFGKIIPVKNNELWGFFGVDGKQITDFKYTNIGCKNSKASNSYPILLIPSHEIIVVQKDQNYNLMRTNGSEIINGYVLEDVYLKTNTATGENTFYMTYGDRTEDIEKKLESLGIE